MRWLAKLIVVGGGMVVISSCTPPPPPPNPAPVEREVFRAAARKLTAVVVSEGGNLDAWIGSRFSKGKPPGDADGGSAVPITADGYFLTADHVLASADGRTISVIYGHGGRLRAHPARIVWRSAESDLALLHVAIETPEFYQWTPPRAWLPQGTPVMHAGIATGFKSGSGKLVSSIPPETAFSGNRRFKHDIPLEPGDSGGPVVDAQGRLVGVNSAVEFLIPLETAFFIESEANRPNVGRLTARIQKDRRARQRGKVATP